MAIFIIVRIIKKNKKNQKKKTNLIQTEMNKHIWVQNGEIKI